MKNTNELSDHLNPEYLFSTTDNSLLLDIISGKIDPKEIALATLQNRGVRLPSRRVYQGRYGAIRYRVDPITGRFIEKNI